MEAKKDKKCQIDATESTDSQPMLEPTSQERVEDDEAAFGSEIHDSVCPNSNTMSGMTNEEQFENATRKVRSDTCINDDDEATALSTQADIERGERQAGALAGFRSRILEGAKKAEKSRQTSARWNEQVAHVERYLSTHDPTETKIERVDQEEENGMMHGLQQIQQADSSTVQLQHAPPPQYDPHRQRMLEQLEKEREDGLTMTETTTEQWTSRRDCRSRNSEQADDKTTIDYRILRWIVASVKEIEKESHRNLPKNASTDPEPDQSTTSSQRIEPTQASTPPLKYWRLPRTQERLNTNMLRIYTDYILRSEYVDDINHMLDRMHNQSRDEAEDIIKSFQDDPSNSDRKVRFIGGRKKSLHWFVLIEDPDPSMYHPRMYQNSRRLPSDGRPRKSNVQLAGSIGLPHVYRRGNDMRHPHGTISIAKAQSLVKKIKESKFRQKKKDSNDEDHSDAKEALRARQRAMLPPPRPIRMSLSTANVAKVPHTQQGPHITPEIGGENVRLTVSQCESIDSLKPPPTPRLKHAELPLSAEKEWELEAVERPDLHSLSLTQRMPGVIHSTPHTQHDVATLSPVQSRPELKYTSVAKVAKSKRTYFSKALPPAATQMARPSSDPQSSPPSEDTQAFEKYRVDISHVLTDSAVQAGSERTKHQEQQQVKPWQLDPHRH
jgi:hypothetical protein